MIDITNDIIKRLEALEEIVFAKGAKKSLKQSTVQTLAGHILNMRDNDFFSQPRIGSEVHAALQERYHCELKRVGVELIRLQRKGELRKASKTVGNKKLVAYVR